MTDPLEASLDDWLDAGVPTDPDWEPIGQADADKLLGALRYVNRRLDEDAAVAAERKAEIDAWQATREDVLDNRRRDLEERLERWARMAHARSGGRDVTWKLPNGELKLRPRQPVVETDATIREEDAVEGLTAAWPELVITKRSLAKSIVKKIGRPGPDPIYDYEAPPGYEARRAVDAESHQVIPGVVFLVPTKDNERSFSVVTP